MWCFTSESNDNHISESFWKYDPHESIHWPRMENEQIKKKKGVITIKLITQFNLSGKWQYNEIPRYTIILINLMMDYVLHNLIYTSIWSGSSKIPLISGAQWYLIYLNFYILVKTGSIYDLFLKNLIFFFFTNIYIVYIITSICICKFKV